VDVVLNPVAHQPLPTPWGRTNWTPSLSIPRLEKIISASTGCAKSNAKLKKTAGKPIENLMSKSCAFLAITGNTFVSKFAPAFFDQKALAIRIPKIWEVFLRAGGGCTLEFSMISDI
jgi:hypothetical protein